jgi:hypothetical protein
LLPALPARNAEIYVVVFIVPDPGPLLVEGDPPQYLATCGPALGITLSEKMMRAADALAGHLRCSREAAVGAAIAEHMLKLGLAKPKDRG